MTITKLYGLPITEEIHKKNGYSKYAVVYNIFETKVKVWFECKTGSAMKYLPPRSICVEDEERWNYFGLIIDYKKSNLIFKDYQFKSMFFYCYLFDKSIPVVCVLFKKPLFNIWEIDKVIPLTNYVDGYDKLTVEEVVKLKNECMSIINRSKNIQCKCNFNKMETDFNNNTIYGNIVWSADSEFESNSEIVSPTTETVIQGPQVSKRQLREYRKSNLRQRKPVKAYDIHNHLKRGVPATECEWRSLKDGTAVLLVSSYSNEKCGDFIEYFIVDKKGKKRRSNPGKAFVSQMRSDSRVIK